VCFLAALALALTVGCGGGDDSIQGVEATRTPTATVSGDDGIQGVEPTATATPEQDDEGITKQALYACINGTDVRLAREAGPVPGQQGVSRANFDLDGTEYAGFVVWPSGAIADIWLAADEDGAKAAEQQYEAVWKQYGQS
jgi:hypothetical protein